MPASTNKKQATDSVSVLAKNNKLNVDSAVIKGGNKLNTANIALEAKSKSVDADALLRKQLVAALKDGSSLAGKTLASMRQKKQ